MIDYIKIEISFYSENLESASEIIVAELNEINFESYEVIKNKVLAYIPLNLFNENYFLNLNFFKNPIFQSIQYSKRIIKSKDWNAVWEKNFQYVVVNKNCIIKAPFHKNAPNKKYEILINPKMAFGTGHHETTFLMLNEMTRLNFKNKIVLDIGCGTGILSILALKMGAKSVIAIDKDEWAVQNAHENCILNNIKNIQILKGNINNIPFNKYDFILSNINLNVLLADLKKYKKYLNNGGSILISGFLKTDIEKIRIKTKELKLNVVHFFEKTNWVMGILKKKE